MIIFLLKFLTFFLRTFTRNSGTALPGLILEKYFNRTLKKLFSQLDNVVLITGTNGKTTTSKILCHLLEQNKIEYITNSSGSNMMRGIASTLLQEASLFGKIKSNIAVLEVEEATMPKLVKFVKPQIIIVTNIFRDQLDAYGEIDKTYQYIKESIENSNNPQLILNYNDERVKKLSHFSTNNIEFISYDEKYLSQIKFENKGENFDIKDDFNLNTITNIEINDDLDLIFDLKSKDKFYFTKKQLNIPGIHNAFNAVAAILAAKILFDNLKLKSQEFILNNLEPAFGRGEIIKYKNTKFQILLVKNPAGMNLNLHLLENVKKRDAILFILNDKIADGRDVSWIWDCNFEILKDLNFKNIYVAGSRRWDMTLRINYELGITNYKLEENVFESINDSIKKLGDLGYEKVFVLPTYTAMREFRDQLSNVTEVKRMYE